MNDLIVRSKYEPHPLPTIADFQTKIDILDQSNAYSDECLISANNDVQAVQSWLAQYSHKDTTFLTYKRESDRLLLWCVHEIGLTLAQLKCDDFSQYIEFLGNPPQRWCTTVGGIRSSGYGRDKWRPFLGPLSASARNTAIRVVNSLLNYLVDANYLRANPLRLIKQRSKFNIKSEEYKYSVWSKILDDTEWAALQQILQNMPEATVFEKDNKMRTQFIFACLYLLGLRISEVAGSSWNAFKFHQGAWWFFVRGKGDKLGHIPVNGQLLAFVKSYRIYLGKTALPTETDTQHLIVSKKTGRALSIKQIYSLIKAVGMQAAQCFAKDSGSYAKLQAVSPHSLRHLSASHQDRAGISMNMIQENLRHSSIHTTKIYVHADDNARSAAMEKIGLDIRSDSVDVLDEHVELRIILKGSSVCTSYALEQLLHVMETKIFSNVKWRRVNNSLDVILQEYAQASSVGLGYKIQYVIDDYQDLSFIEQCKVNIMREAEIRLFTANVISI